MNTRFCPTCNGDASVGILHLGHLYLCLVNEYMAHSTGGRFVVRFDDNQQAWRAALGQDAMRRNAATIRKELEWAGVKVDEWVYQSEIEPTTKAAIAAQWPGLKEPGGDYTTVPTLVREDSPQYPYAPYLTAESVLLDAWAGIDTMIVGDELLSRYSLYQWMAEQLNVPQIKHIYLPRLRGRSQGGELDHVSKTRGNHKLSRFMEARNAPKEVRFVLREACLTNFAGEWDWQNIRPQPRLP